MFGWCWEHEDDDDGDDDNDGAFNERHFLGSSPGQHSPLLGHCSTLAPVLATLVLRYTNTNTQTQIHKYKYTNTNTQIQIHKYKYTNTNTKNNIELLSQLHQKDWCALGSLLYFFNLFKIKQKQKQNFSFLWKLFFLMWVVGPLRSWRVLGRIESGASKYDTIWKRNWIKHFYLGYHIERKRWRFDCQYVDFKII